MKWVCLLLRRRRSRVFLSRMWVGGWGGGAGDNFLSFSSTYGGGLLPCSFYLMKGVGREGERLSRKCEQDAIFILVGKRAGGGVDFGIWTRFPFASSEGEREGGGRGKGEGGRGRGGPLAKGKKRHIAALRAARRRPPAAAAFQKWAYANGRRNEK